MGEDGRSELRELGVVQENRELLPREKSRFYRWLEMSGKIGKAGFRQRVREYVRSNLDERGNETVCYDEAFVIVARAVGWPGFDDVVADGDGSETSYQGRLLRAGLGQSSSAIKDVTWVYNNLSVPWDLIDITTVPSAGAVGHLIWAKDNPGEFFRVVHPKLLPSRTQIESMDRYTDDGREVLELCEEYERRIEQLDLSLVSQGSAFEQ